MDKIETERLYLRKFELTDAEAVFRYSINPLVSRYTGDAGLVKEVADAKKIITDVWFKDYEEYGYGRLALIEKSSETLIGFCGLKYLPEFKLADLGYRMLPEYWGKGYATESSKAALDYGVDTLGMKKIMAMTMIENKASQNVLLKLGFVETERMDIDGHDCNIFHFSPEKET